MTDKEKTEILAAACHSAWYAYTVIGLGEDGEPWDKAPDWQKDSIRDGVRFWEGQLKGFKATAGSFDTEQDYEAAVVEWARRHLPERSHENWMLHKRNHGWVYGAEKDVEKKTHPCMVPYSDLPEEQRAKDVVVVEAFLAVRSVF